MLLQVNAIPAAFCPILPTQPALLALFPSFFPNSEACYAPPWQITEEALPAAQPDMSSAPL